MSTIMIDSVTIACVAMLIVNILFMNCKRVDTLFVIAMITSLAFAVVAEATGIFAAFHALSTDAVAKAAVEAVTNASGYFIVSALATFFAVCFAVVLTGVKEVKNHILVSLGFYVCLGVGLCLFLRGSSFVF